MKPVDQENGEPARAGVTRTAAVLDTADAATTAPGDRRAHRRVPRQLLDWIELARMKYGPEVDIVDLSRTGVLIETDRPLAPGARQALEIAGTDGTLVVPF